jgi:hypothetical protein
MHTPGPLDLAMSPRIEEESLFGSNDRCHPGAA